jgi:hypothetical protein
MGNIQDMRLKKSDFFHAAYPRQLTNKLLCCTAYSSKFAATGVLAAEKSCFDSQQELNFLFPKFSTQALWPHDPPIQKIQLPLFCGYCGSDVTHTALNVTMHGTVM